MRKTVIVMAAVSALALGFSTAAFAVNNGGNGNGGIGGRRRQQ